MTATQGIGAWAQAQFAPMSGRHALITGAASGIGLATAQALAALGARLTLLDVNAEAGARAAQSIAAESGVDVDFETLDLSDLAAVRSFCTQRPPAQVDVLVNNAGILPPLRRMTTAPGHELAFAISVFGHFALTAGLWPRLEQQPAARVVWVSSLVHRQARIDLDDLHSANHYEAQRAYNQAKLASLMLALECDARARAAGSRVTSLAAHPGVAKTGIGHSREGQPRRGLHDHLTDIAFHSVMRLLGRPPEIAARPIVQAAADATLPGGSLFGPGGPGEMLGRLRLLQPAARARDPQARQRLWEACERATAIPWERSPTDQQERGDTRHD
ncbi:SDR family NAD(P)-dependent oxidoreductase [Algiphilus sp.]|uniref:SDR family NAD(P)-dependent oxidoreductase n=1 Tax=Algiphilus sp. TaxID=1872431 RepID=UPI0032EB3D83